METSSKRILIVDDEARIVDIIGEFLTLGGYTVEKAYNGQQGIDIINKKAVDLIVLDEKMPGMSGMEMLKKIKGMKLNIPVIVLTGSVNVAEIKQYKKKLYKHLLYKPIRIAELEKLIKKILASKKSPAKKKT